MAPEKIPEEATNGWSVWSKRILYQLEMGDKNYERIIEQIEQMRIDIALLKFKSMLFGALAGSILSAAMTLLIEYLKRRP